MRSSPPRSVGPPGRVVWFGSMVGWCIGGWACTPDHAKLPHGTDSADPSDDDGSPDTGPHGDTGPWGDVVRCSEGMSAVLTADGDTAFCIDTWEVVVVEGSSDGSTPTIATSSPGVIPSTGVSFDEAVEICANTPVRDAGGTEVGHKHLSTSDEWRDAMDGIFGEGGTHFPYGDDYESGRCATLGADMQPVWSTLQETGSLPDCVSAFGTYDQLGNAWEWANPEQVIDIAAWQTTATALGVAWAIEADGRIRVLDGDIGLLQTDVAGVASSSMAVDADGFLTVEALPESWSWQVSPATGYLRLSASVAPDDLTASYLPLSVVPLDLQDLPGPAHLFLRRDEDGAPFTDKRGCAYYSGDPANCGSDDPYNGHVHDFNGTISFRCVSAPLQ
jgi:hypothetical protein